MVGELKFKSKKACREHFQAMLYRYEVNRRLNDKDLQEFLWLLERHPESDQKIGAGVSFIAVEMHPVFITQRCFRIYRVDGSRTDVSFLSCVNGTAKPLLTRWIEAMRNEISGQIIAFKQQCFAESSELQCEITGQIVNWHNSHVDHIVPFADIANMFFQDMGIAPSASALEEPQDNQYQERFTDATIAGKWAAYHMAKARLRIVTANANLSRPRKAGAK